MNVWSLSAIIFLLNLPFGFWRSRVRKFSWQWILSIHLPIPAIILLRIYSGIGFQLYTYPITISSFFLGQYIGGKLGAAMKPAVSETTVD